MEQIQKSFASTMVELEGLRVPRFLHPEYNTIHGKDGSFIRILDLSEFNNLSEDDLANLLRRHVVIVKSGQSIFEQAFNSQDFSPKALSTVGNIFVRRDMQGQIIILTILFA
jgi:hypothetical protein